MARQLRGNAVLVWAWFATAGVGACSGSALVADAARGPDSKGDDAPMRDAGPDVADAVAARPELGACPTAVPVVVGTPADAAARDGGPGSATLCSQGWCRAAREPTSWFLEGVWGSSDDDVWVAGNPSGTLDSRIGGGPSLLHFDGISWSIVDGGGVNGLAAVWGSARDDVWAVGEGIAHWDGTRWSKVLDGLTYDDFPSISGSGPNDVWVTLGSHNGVHWDGNQWTSVDVPGFHVWSAGPNDVWAVGEGVSHFDGVRWSTDLTFGYLEAVWGSGPSDVWASGSGATIHWDGVRWSKAVGAPGVFAFWGTGPNDVWGTNWDIYHWDGTAWSRSASSRPYSGGAIWAFGDADVWAMASMALFHWNGVEWTSVFTFPSDFLPRCFAASGPNDLWVVGGGGVFFHWNGTAWSSVPSGTTKDLTTAWATSARDAWAAGDGALLHWNGKAWTEDPANVDGSFRSVWGTSTNDAWVVGFAQGAGSHASGSGIVRHWDGKSWSDRTPTCVSPSFFIFTDIWGVAADDVWLVDVEVGNGQWSILHWDGAGWSFSARNQGRSIGRVRGDRADDVWAISTFDGVSHWNGKAWTVNGTNAPEQLFDLSVLAPDDVWAIGRFGVARWDGTSWYSPGPAPTFAGWSVPGGSSWAVGTDGQILRRQ
jgi:hypothetical protein